MLCATVDLVDKKNPNNIVPKSWWERLMLTSPEAFKFNESKNGAQSPFHLVKDPTTNMPTFERNLYCHLDYDMLILIICVINLIDYRTENPMVAICVGYFIERFFKWLRFTLGEKNLIKKTFTDASFML